MSDTGHHSVDRSPSRSNICDIWSSRGIQGICTASIWKNDFGVELRVEHDGQLIESRLSRDGEAPLLLIADQLKANLMEQGWFEVPNAVEPREQP